MIMVGHPRRLREPLRWGRRERSAVAALLAVVAAAAIALGVYAATSGAPARADCIDITFASTLGGAKLHACGAQARAVCAAPGEYRQIAAQLKAACRRAGFPYAPAK
jgi:hypothetical protein